MTEWGIVSNPKLSFRKFWNRVLPTHGLRPCRSHKYNLIKTLGKPICFLSIQINATKLNLASCLLHKGRFCGSHYISELLQVYTPSRNLWSSSMLLLIEPKSQHSLGDRSFSSAAPHIWNSLCTTKFKSLLKTYLMSYVFKD